MSYRSGRSPGYRRRTRLSSSLVSPRRCSSRDRSSAPWMKASRSRRFNSALRWIVAWASLRMSATLPEAESSQRPTEVPAR